jgi:hypothetical protein
LGTPPAISNWKRHPICLCLKAVRTVSPSRCWRSRTVRNKEPGGRWMTAHGHFHQTSNRSSRPSTEHPTRKRGGSRFLVLSGTHSCISQCDCQLANLNILLVCFLPQLPGNCASTWNIRRLSQVTYCRRKKKRHCAAGWSLPMTWSSTSTFPLRMSSCDKVPKFQYAHPYQCETCVRQDPSATGEN